MTALPAIACFFCGVDSQAVLFLFLAVVGLLLGSAIFLLIWAAGRGDFRNIEGPKYDVFKNEEDHP